MKKIRYFIYDVLNISNNNEIKIYEFEYDSTTLAFDFYYNLYKEYIVKNKSRLDEYKDIINSIAFVIMDTFDGVYIDDFSKELFFWETMERHTEDKVYCIKPIFPVGDVVARYHNYKIIIHSNENNHLRFPHVHVYDQIGQCATVSLLNFKMDKGLPIKRKDKKIIIDYIKDDKDRLIEYYNRIINHKEVEKLVIDIKV